MADRERLYGVDSADKAVDSPDALTGSGWIREGAQVVDSGGLPEGYVPPSASLNPPTSSGDDGAASD